MDSLIQCFMPQFGIDNSVILVGAIAIFLLVVIVLLVMVIKQRRQLQQMEAQNQQRTGFLGKPLASVAIVAMMAGGFGLTYFASQPANMQEPIDISANQAIEFQIITDIEVINSRESNVEFKLVPLVDGVQWGGNNRNLFDVFWTIKGPKNFSEIELELSKSRQGGFVRTLPRGKYIVNVEVIYNEITFNAEKGINV